ncbi:MAG: hypothetical protein WDZ94_05725 [Patescibacteria group bacterium]
MSIVYKFKSIAGSTIIEILVAIAVVGVVLTALTYSLSFSVKNSAQAEYRQIASRYAQNSIEMLRAERADRGWSDFKDAFPPDNTNDYYCLRSADDLTDHELYGSTLDLTATTCNQTHNQPKADFQRLFRTVEQSDEPGNEFIAVEVVVTWRDGAEVRSTSIEQVFRDI